MFRICLQTVSMSEGKEESVVEYGDLQSLISREVAHALEAQKAEDMTSRESA